MPNAIEAGTTPSPEFYEVLIQAMIFDMGQVNPPPHAEAMRAADPELYDALIDRSARFLVKRVWIQHTTGVLPPADMPRLLWQAMVMLSEGQAEAARVMLALFDLQEPPFRPEALH